MYNLIISKKSLTVSTDAPTPGVPFHSTWRGSFYLFAFLLSAWALSSCTTSFYIVRHAEKSTSPKENPVLTEAGSQRAERLKKILENKGIERVYSTKTVRTTTTAKPLANARKIEIEIYEPKNQSALIETLKKSKQNTLIVGHSNTIRHIINGLSEKEFLKKDLEDSEYSNLYLVKRGKLGKPKAKVQQY
ncbi:phosphoglycerate mutase family protein [Lacihabitans soyangensis]|uniref:Histidine phosphatase family protein n=1 Tax=Lacihabitans soyangensis TaxID=869394 RepID=A0AAE3GZS8_9BACT|nr:phosphoglycerate mutase family protein [Lacihabitans soyangensis]MCP9762198.1 histidine phosphatase family protein [Lacihabitans soyangensis]